MSVHICDRCGDITVNAQTCTCASPFDQVDILRRRDIVIVATRGSRRDDRSETYVFGDRNPKMSA